MGICEHDHRVLKLRICVQNVAPEQSCERMDNLQMVSTSYQPQCRGAGIQEWNCRVWNHVVFVQNAGASADTEYMMQFDLLRVHLTKMLFGNTRNL